MRSLFIVLEDEVGLGRLIARGLEELGDVSLVHTAPDCIAILDRRPANLALVWADLVLRPGRGWDAVEAARTWYTGSIFVVSAHSTSENVFRATLESAFFLPKDQAIEKPFRWEVIRRLVIDTVWFLLEETHWAAREVLDALGLTAADREVALGAANEIDPELLRTTLHLAEHAWKSRVHRLLVKLGMRGKSLKDAGDFIRRRILARMHAPMDERFASTAP